MSHNDYQPNTDHSECLSIAAEWVDQMSNVQQQVVLLLINSQPLGAKETNSTDTTAFGRIYEAPFANDLAMLCIVYFSYS